jgi:hypothetical protein
MDRACSTHEREEKCKGGFGGKPEGKRPLGRSRRRRQSNIKMDLSRIRWSGMDCINIAQDMDQWWVLVNTLMNLRVLQNFG